MRKLFNRDVFVYGGMEFFFWAMFQVQFFISALLADEGFSSTTVGILMGLVSLMGILGSTLAGNLADRLGSASKVYRILFVLAACIFLIVPLFLHTQILGITLGFVFILLWAFTARPMQGLTESIVVSAADRKRTFSFGTARYLGSFSASLSSVIYGMIGKGLGHNRFIFLTFGIVGLPLFFLAMMAGKEEAPRIVEQKEKVGPGAALKNYYLVMFFICHCLVCLPMSCSMSFFPYKLAEIGHPEILGSMNAVRSFMEIPILIAGTWFMRKIGLKHMFHIDIVLYIIAMLIQRYTQSVALITVAMVLMGIAYGFHLSAQVTYVYLITPKEATASAQSLAVSFSLIASVLINFAGGVIIDTFSTTGLYMLLAIVECTALLLFLLTFPIGRLLGKQEPDLSAAGQ